MKVLDDSNVHDPRNPDFRTKKRDESLFHHSKQCVAAATRTIREFVLFKGLYISRLYGNLLRNELLEVQRAYALRLLLSLIVVFEICIMFPMNHLNKYQILFRKYLTHSIKNDFAIIGLKSSFVNSLYRRPKSLRKLAGPEQQAPNLWKLKDSFVGGCKVLRAVEVKACSPTASRPSCQCPNHSTSNETGDLEILISSNSDGPF